MSDCAAVNPNGSIETERDTINRLVKNRDELFQHLQSQKTITKLAVKALQQIASGGFWNADRYIEIAQNSLSEIARSAHEQT